jgi:hypothetical protein
MGELVKARRDLPMRRQTLIAAAAVALCAGGLSHAQDAAPSAAPTSRVQSAELPPPGAPAPAAPAPPQSGPVLKTYSRDEVVNGVSDFMGVTAEAAGGVVERLFIKNGQPVGYIAGEEGSGAIFVGGRYGRGMLYMKDREPVEIFWQGPSVGWDLGGNASRVFTLVYDLEDVNQLYQRFPGVEGSAYVVGGMGVNYQKANGVTLAPIRAGVGLRLGANVGYLSYTKKRNIIPF